jgi:hypothetical protein
MRGQLPVTYFHRSLVLGCSLLALSACGPDDIVSPGTGGNVNIGITTPAPSPTPTPTGPAAVTPAGTCPTITDPQGLTDKGTITGPTGEWRVCELPRTITKSSTLPKIAGLLYSMNGRVDVGCDGGFSAPTAAKPYTSTTVGCTTPLTADTNVTLTIEPGVILFGNTGQSWLAVNRGNKINAVGTVTAPIIFTSKDNVGGLNSDSSIGQWGGVVLMGRGKVTDCNVGSVASGTCERDTEGAVDLARYGGNDDTYNAGTLKYIQIRYSGFVLSADKELQSLTNEGVGSGTTIDYIQSFNSSDDGTETFGGNLSMKHYIATGADDDSIDVDTGARLNVDWALLIQRPGQGDTFMEIDSNGFESDTPRTKFQLSNFTAIQPQTSSNNEGGGDLASILLRGNSDTTWANGVIVSPNNECLRMNGSGTAPATLVAHSVVMTCNGTKYLGSGSYTAAQVQAMFGSGSSNNNDNLTSTLTSLFVNGANEDGVPAFDATALSVFFDTAAHIGAAWSGNTDWYTHWTCNSSYAPLGGDTDCTSLPTT